MVEDDPSMRRSIERLLAIHGFIVESFSSAETFLERGHIDRVGCLVLDIHLSGTSGLELRACLIEAGSSIPIIFITALEDDDIEAAAARLGCVAYLRKPFPPDLLVSAVNRALTDRPSGWVPRTRNVKQVRTASPKDNRRGGNRAVRLRWVKEGPALRPVMKVTSLPDAEFAS